jgi:hypothetical protein
VNIKVKNSECIYIYSICLRVRVNRLHLNIQSHATLHMIDSVKVLSVLDDSAKSIEA